MDPADQIITTVRIDRLATIADVLRGMEAVRRDLARSMRGDAGAFTGFTQLITNNDALGNSEGPVDIAISATATRDAALFTEVDLRASVVHITPAGADLRTVAAGAGVTIYPSLPPARRGTQDADCSIRVGESA